PRGAHYAVQVVIISSTATEVARHGVLGFLTGRSGVGFQQRYRGHDLTGCAETTGRAEFFDEGLLDRVQGAVGGSEPFYCYHFTLLDGVGQHGTGVVVDVINQHSTGTTFTTVA